MLNTLRTARADHPVAETEQLRFVSVVEQDELDRNVYGLLGIPVDAVDFPNLLKQIATVTELRRPFLISTPNVNFLMKSQKNAAFRESILASDLCLVDGMPLIWIAKLLRVAIKERVAGSDLFGRLKAKTDSDRRLRVFLFGGADDLAAKVGAKLNASDCGLECVGALNPGFGSIEDMSTPEIIRTINASQADLLAVFFGAEKAQTWLIHNHWHLRPPLRAQFGATINFEAGTVKRAPPMLRSTGFEWLWRIKEEPYLWRRYWNDGLALSRLFLTCVLPMMFGLRWVREDAPLSITAQEDQFLVKLRLSGAATEVNVQIAINAFHQAFLANKRLVVDLSQTDVIDARFFGLLLMVRKRVERRQQALEFVGISPRLRRWFHLNRFEYLLPSETS